MINKHSGKVFAVVMGIVVGAVGTLAITNKNNQRKINDFLAKAKATVDDYADTMHDKLRETKTGIDTVKSNVENEIGKGKKTAQQVVNKTIDSTIDTANNVKKEVNKV